MRVQPRGRLGARGVFFPAKERRPFGRWSTGAFDGATSFVTAWRARAGAAFFALSPVAAGAAAYVVALWLGHQHALVALERPWPAAVMALAVSVGSLLAFRVITHLRAPALGRPRVARPVSRLAAFDLGLLLVVATMLLLAFVGGVEGPLYPLTYALVAYFFAFYETPEALVLLAALVALEAVSVFSGQPSRAASMIFVSHLTFNGFFALLYALFLRGDLAKRRRDSARAVASEIQSMYEDARDYRFIASVWQRPRSDAEADKRRALSSVAAVREAVYNLLAVAEKALRPNNLALYMLDDASERLRLRELRGHGEHLEGGPLSAREGVFGGILTKKAPLVLTRLNHYRGLVYYRALSDQASKVREFIGVPLLDGAHVRGVLLADRVQDEPFDEADLALLEILAKEVMRTVEVERLFSEMDRERRHREKFLRASQALASARTLDEVTQAAWQAVSYLCHPTLLALSVCEPEGQGHVLASVRGPLLDPKTCGHPLGDASALVNSALKTRAVLPLPGVTLNPHSLFGKDVAVAGFGAARVFPLFAQNRAIGAWVVAVDAPHFAPEIEGMLTSLSHQVAVCVENARMNERMEKMATTDGLTGLSNRRHFNDVFASRLDLSSRYGRKMSLILCDIDHFKSVNDTYGHPTGDVVLKAVSKLLQNEARKTDAVGRLGGEEFAILMEETDLAGAHHTAERIRERVMREVIMAENGKLQVTLSLGVATYPDDGNSLELLISHADEALYRAKQGGRNRTVAYAR